MTVIPFSRDRRAALGLALAAALTVSVPALAADAAAAKAVVDAAKARGEVGVPGERYLGLESGPPPAAARAAVMKINAGRAEADRDTAAKTGLSAEAAGQATARQLVARIPSGQYFKPLDGGWTRK